MRAHEFINEAKVTDTAKLDGSNGAAMPNAQSYPEMVGHFYDMYKFGVAAAMSPEQLHDYARQSIGPDLLTLSYTEGDQEILNKAAKIMGVKAKKLSSKGSEENKDTHRVSPVAAPKRNRYGV